MAADLSRDMLAGAQLVNMGWQRQERMMQLRTQEAYRQMQERQLAAQAQMLTEHALLYKQQREDEANQQAVALAAADHADYLYNDVGLDRDEAQQTAILAASLVHPVAGEKMARAYHALKGTTTANVPANIATAKEVGRLRTQLDSANNELLESGIGEVSPETDAKREKIAALQAQYDYLQGANEARVAKLEAETKQIKEGVKPQFMEAEDGRMLIYNPKTGRYTEPDKKMSLQEFIGKHLNTMISEEGSADAAVAKLKDVYEKLYGDRSNQKSQKSSYEVGKMYRDSKGNKAIYQADGTWKEIK